MPLSIEQNGYFSKFIGKNRHLMPSLLGKRGPMLVKVLKVLLNE